MHIQAWYAQHQATGAIGRTLEGITCLIRMQKYTQFRAAVAYATLSGCKILAQRARTSSIWKRCEKRWLISIDFGRTEPAALEFLAELPGAEVRIPDGAQLVTRSGFLPFISFHPKTYSVDDFSDGKGRTLGIFLGSGNLTASGLLTGSESGVLSQWMNPSRSQWKAMKSAYAQMSWFDHAWQSADPLADIISKYKKYWRKSKPPFSEENPNDADLYIGGTGYVVAGSEALGLVSARALWVEVGTLYKNRGPDKPGNQVDLQRGSRVFFGFSPKPVPRNTVLGQILLRSEGYNEVRCSVRYGNNQMDKVNLPVPGTDGPSSYDNSILLFERTGLGARGLRSFRVLVGNEAELKRWKKKSASATDLTMRSGRRYGLLY